MKKKKKINKKKFIKRIIQLVLIIVIIILIIKILTPKSEEKIETSKLIVNNTDITQTLESDMYIDGENDVYLSTNDIKNIFDKDLYYEESSNKIISTCRAKVGAIDLNSNILEINSASIVLSKGSLTYDSKRYIPLSELTSLYNLEISVRDKVAIVNSLYNELITAKLAKNVSLKESTSIFSNTVEKMKKDDTIIFIENAEKSGWIKVLTYNGNFGYIKENAITEKNQIRLNMEDNNSNLNPIDLEKSIEINKKDLTTAKLENFDKRKTLTSDLVKKMISKETFTVKMNLKDVNVENEKLERFIIELLPRIKEIGGTLVVTNNSILGQDFLTNNKIQIN